MASPTKLTAEQLEAIRRFHGNHHHPDCSSCPALLAHIAALEGELAEARNHNRERLNKGHTRAWLSMRERAESAEAAVRELGEWLQAYCTRHHPGMKASASGSWSEPTARVLKELGL